jgi:RNA polymerase sigma factor (TIGR02999 family)
MLEQVTAPEHAPRDRSADANPCDRLFPAVYDELRRIAHRHMLRERHGHVLDTTALVHECYLNLADRTTPSWDDRAHFLAIASKAMRHILIDYARRRKAQKRGGDRHRVTLEDRMVAVDAQAAELLSLDEALTALARRHARMATVVERRFFGGMTISETAASLDVSTRTVEKDWTRAKAYLRRALAPQQHTS